jgi:membrane protein
MFGSLWEVFRATLRGMEEDRASTMGAALAYYTAFSLAPTLVIALAVAGLFFDRGAAEAALIDQLAALVGPNGAQAIQAMLRGASDGAGGLLSTAISAGALVLGATTVFSELQRDLNRIWKVPDPATQGWMRTLQTRLLSLGVTLGIGFLLVVSLLLSAAVALVTRIWSQWLGGVETLLHILDFGTSFLLMTLLFAMIYKLLPNVRIAWRDVWLGAGGTALLFAAGKLLIGLYIGRSTLSSSFGAAGTFVVLLVWIYYSAQIFFFGAEFTRAFAQRRARRSGAGSGAPLPGAPPHAPVAPAG